MRWKCIIAACAALACVGFANPANADILQDRDRPAGWGHARPIRHWVYYPRYVHNYHVDPYAYQHSPRHYYPYRHSNYWQPTETVKARGRAHYNNWNVQAPRYKYHPSWGHSRNWDGHEYVPTRRAHRDDCCVGH